MTISKKPSKSMPTQTRTKGEIENTIQIIFNCVPLRIQMGGQVDEKFIELQMQEIKPLLDEYAQTYANERFEKAMVEKREDEEGDDFLSEYEKGYNDCREDFIKNWNEAK